MVMFDLWYRIPRKDRIITHHVLVPRIYLFACVLRISVHLMLRGGVALRVNTGASLPVRANGSMRAKVWHN